MLICKECKFESNDLDEVCYYDINGDSHSDEQDIERYLNNPDALAHILCPGCADNFDFEGGNY